MTATQEPTIARLYRTEVEVAANAVIAMLKAGLLARGVTVQQMADAVGVTPEDMRLASVRAERVTARRLAPTAEPTRNIAPLVPLRPDCEPRLPAVEPATNGVRTSKVAHAPREQFVGEHTYMPPKTEPPAWTPPAKRYTEAGRKRAAEAIFAQWRVRGNLDCSRCGHPIYSGSDAVVESAHHADQCP